MSKKRTRSRRNPPDRKPITLFVVRHGDAGGQRLPGELSVPLTAKGRKQAARLAERFADEKLDHIYHSDLARARSTAEPVIANHPKTPATASRDIREVHAYHNTHERNYGGRKLRARLREERERAERFARMLLRKHKPGQRVLIVAHGCLNRLLFSILCGLRPKQCPILTQQNTCVNVLEIWNDRRPVVRAVNNIEHLPPSLR
jgi:broad specificity phosphatase PhoE